MVKKLFLIGLAILPRAALSYDTSEFLWSPAYDSLEDAAIAALEYVAEVSAEDDEPTEYLGIVYKINGKYLFTVPIAGDASKALVSDIRYPKVASLAAIYHNHVSGEGNEEFSSIDIRTATDLNVPTYLYVSDTGEIRKWNPDDRSSIHFRRGIGNPQTRGELVAKSK